MLITLLMATPLVGATLVLMTPSDRVQAMKATALSTTVVTFGLSLYLWVAFDAANPSYQYVATAVDTSFCSLRLGVDGLSLYYVLLTTLLMPVCVLAGWDSIHTYIKGYLVAIILILFGILAVFMVMDLVLFYVAFEAVLIPMYLIVGVWGASAARVRAAYLLFLYTLAGSLFMLLAVLDVYAHLGTTEMSVVTLSELDGATQCRVWLGFGLAFAVKTPLVPFHVWLPRAHAEAPLAGSMVLAGLVLKLATYGILRVLLGMLPEATAYYAPATQVVAVVTIVYSSLATLRQSDTKALIAYSSVAHMGIVSLGLFSNTLEGIEGALLLSLAHGLVSPALFYLVGGVLYSRYHTRVIRYYRGLALMMPLFGFMLFGFTLCNMAVPLSLNWYGEILALVGTFDRSPLMASLGALSIVLSAGYSVWLYGRMATGDWSPYLSYAPDLTRLEYSVLWPLLALTVLFGCCPNAILTDVHSSVAGLLYVA